VGAWIEIIRACAISFAALVAPPVGAWIEIKIVELDTDFIKVAPPVGAWIEIVKSGRNVL